MRKRVNKLAALFMAAFLAVGMLPSGIMANAAEPTGDSEATEEVMEAFELEDDAIPEADSTEAEPEIEGEAEPEPEIEGETESETEIEGEEEAEDAEITLYSTVEEPEVDPEQQEDAEEEDVTEASVSTYSTHTYNNSMVKEIDDSYFYTWENAGEPNSFSLFGTGEVKISTSGGFYCDYDQALDAYGFYIDTPSDDAFTIENAITIQTENVGTINGRSIDFYLNVDKAIFGDSTSADTHIGNTREVFELHDGYFYFVGGSGWDQTIGVPSRTFDAETTVKFTDHETGEVIDIPIYQHMYDVDLPIESNKDNEPYREGYELYNSYFSKYIIYESCSMEIIGSESDATTLFQSDNPDTNAQGETSYLNYGGFAVAKNGEVKEIMHGGYSCGNTLELYSEYLNITDPEKSVTSTGSNADGSYAPEDTVSFAVEQKIGSQYVDTFDPYTSLTFTDAIPDGLTYVSDSAAMYDGDEDITSTAGEVSYDSSTNTLTYTFSNDWLNAFDANYNGQTLKMTFDCTVDSTVETPTTIENTAYTTFSGLKYDSNTVEIPVNAPALAIVKNVDGEQYYVGDEVTYTIDVTQTVEDLTAENVVITDTLPDEVELADVVLDGVSGTVSIDGNSFEATCPTLAYGETASLTVTATAVTAGTGVVNTAYADADNTDPVDDDATIEILEPEEPEVTEPALSITKTADKGTYYVGETVTYTINVSQTVEDVTAENVVITDTLPDELELVNVVLASDSVEGTVTTDGNSFTVTCPALAYGETASLIVTATALTAGTGVVNTAYADADDTEPVDDDETVDILEPEEPEVKDPELAISKKADGTVYSVNDTVTYTIVVNEIRDGAIARNVTVTDTVPGELELVSVETDMGEASVSGNSFTVYCGDMEITDTATITVTATAMAEGEGIVNTAYAVADNTDEVSDDWTVAVRRPEISIEKTADGRTYYPGDTVNYNITIKNLKETAVIPAEDEEAETDAGVVEETAVILIGDKYAEADAYVAKETSVIPAGDEYTETEPDAGDYTESEAEAVEEGLSDVAQYEGSDAGTDEYAADIEGSDGDAYYGEDAGEADTYEDAGEADAEKEAVIDEGSIDTFEAEPEQEADPEEEAVENVQLLEAGPEMIEIDATDGSVPTAYNVVISDTLPEGLYLVDVTASDGGIVEINGNSFTVTYPEMYYGQEFSVNVVATIDESLGNTEITNVAVVDSDTTDPIDDYEEIEVIKPLLEITKTADKSTYYVGDDVEYTVDVRQTIENLTAENVVISDTLPDELQLIDVMLEGVDGGVSVDGNSFTVNCPALSFGETAHITVTAKAVTAGEGVINTAYADADHADPVDDDETVDILEEPGGEHGREYFPIDEEIVPDYTDRTTWVKDEAVNEYNAIELEMSTLLPVIEPDDLAGGSFVMTFHEVLDHELNLDEADADFMVFIGGNQISHDYYTVTLGSGVSPLATYSVSPVDDGCTFHVDVDLTALYLDGVITDEDLQGDTEIIIFFFADLEGTNLNGSYKSTVWYEVYDGENWEYTSNEDVVYVYTYDVSILKYDASTLKGDDYDDSALAGATLGIYYDSECAVPVIRNGEPYAVTSGEDGLADFYGLADGPYYVKETEAPEGYVLSTEVMTVILGEDLNDTGYTYNGVFANTPETEEEPGSVIAVDVTKKWDDNDNAEGARPTSIVVVLYRNEESTGRVLILKDENGWCGDRGARREQAHCPEINHRTA